MADDPNPPDDGGVCELTDTDPNIPSADVTYVATARQVSRIAIMADISLRALNRANLIEANWVEPPEPEKPSTRTSLNNQISYCNSIIAAANRMLVLVGTADDCGDDGDDKGE